MTNELKPCPFCGGEGTLSVSELPGLSSEVSFYVGCDTCECSTSYEDTDDEAIKKWNTRQPAFDWKPIEELTEDEFLTESHFLFYNNQNDELPYHTGFRYSNFIDVGCTLEKIWIHGDSYNFKEISEQYTHYALLTPPQTNQS